MKQEILISLIRESVKPKLDDLVESIRLYSTSQVALWQKIPYLVLQAFGRGGFGDNDRWAYEKGIYSISASNSMMVDCETGEIVSSFAKDRSSRLAPNNVVIKFAFSLNGLDAENILDNLRRKIEHSEHSPIENFAIDTKKFKTVEEWKKSEQEKYGLHPDYYKRKE